MDDFELLLNKNTTLEKTQEKWMKNLSEGHIKLLNSIYTLKVTDNKRRLIYKKGKLIGTEAFIINKNKEILNKKLTPFNEIFSGAWFLKL